MFCLLLLFSSFCFASEVQVYREPISNPMENRSSSDDISSTDEELCNMAMSRFSPDVHDCIKPHLRAILAEVPASPDNVRPESNAQFLQRVSTQANIDELNQRRMNDMIVQATHKAFLEKELQIQDYQQRISQQYTGRQAAIIAGVVSAISTSIATICATVISLKSK